MSSDRGDRELRFERLFRANYSIVAGYLARRAESDLVDDLVDEVFLVAWRRLDRVPADPVPWLLRVARNVLGTHIRGARRSRALSVRVAANQIDVEGEESRFDAREIAAALAELSPKDREALLLVDWDGLTPSQAAISCGVAAVAFRVRLHRARNRFRILIQDPATDSTTQARVAKREVPNV